MSDERSLSERLESLSAEAREGCGVADDLLMLADRASALEAEVQELRELRDLVTEAQKVAFTNNDPENEYPVQVWSHHTPYGVHPWTWGTRGARPTPDVITRALTALRAVEEIGAEEAQS